MQNYEKNLYFVEEKEKKMIKEVEIEKNTSKCDKVCKHAGKHQNPTLQKLDQIEKKNGGADGKKTTYHRKKNNNRTKISNTKVLKMILNI